MSDMNVTDNDIVQIGFVVEDLEEAMDNYCEILNVEEWYIYTFGSETGVENFTYRGEEVDDFEYKIALGKAGDMQFELIEPVRNVPVFEKVLEEEGEGFHHIKQKVKTENIEEAVEEFADRGIEKLGGGTYKDDIFIYLKTKDPLGIIWELGNAADIGEPEEIYFP